MNFLSWMLVALIALWLVAAVAHIVRHRGGCSCGGGGADCCGDCARCVGCTGRGKEKNPPKRCAVCGKEKEPPKRCG